MMNYKETRKHPKKLNEFFEEPDEDNGDDEDDDNSR